MAGNCTRQPGACTQLKATTGSRDDMPTRKQKQALELAKPPEPRKIEEEMHAWLTDSNQKHAQALELAEPPEPRKLSVEHEQDLDKLMEAWRQQPG